MPRQVHVRTAVALTLLTAALAPAAQAGATAVPRLARTTTIVATRSAATVVMLPRAATVRVDTVTGHSDNVAVTGNGRMAAFDLRADDGTPTAAHLLGVLANGCYAARCTARLKDTFTTAYRFAAVKSGHVATYTLPAGRYRLLVVADGVAVTVRLRLDGLTGATTLHPAAAAQVGWQPLAANASLGTPPALVAYSAPAGALPVGSHGGVLVTVFDVRLSAGDFGQRGFCHYGTTQEQPVYVAGCPGGDADTAQSITGPIPQEHVLRAMQFVEGDMAARSGSTGLYYDNVGVVESIDALSLRIAY